MEILVSVIMLLVGLSFCVKLSFHGPLVTLLTAAVAAIVVRLSLDSALESSSTQIEEWLQSPSLMLDTAVLLTIDVMFQIAYCCMAADGCAGRRNLFAKVIYGILYYIPGLLIFPVLCAMLVEVIFAFPGIDFGLLGWLTAGSVLVVTPLLAWLIRYLLEERELRLELLFMLSALTGILGIIACVNGRTATEGISEVNFPALGAIAALLAAGTLVGLILYNRHK